MISATGGIITRVVTQMRTLANIGQVHDRVRLATREADMLSLLTTEIGGERRLRAWLVHLGRLQTSAADSGSRMNFDRTLLIEGFADFEDAAGSESVLISLAENVIRELWYDAQTTKLAASILWAEPPALVDLEPRMFAGVVCSYVRIEMGVHVVEDFTNP